MTNRRERRRRMPRPPAGKRWSWTQSICDDCWDTHGDPFREPMRLSAELRENEQCGWCGRIHRSGIYSRQDPTLIPYPRLEHIQ